MMVFEDHEYHCKLTTAAVLSIDIRLNVKKIIKKSFPVLIPWEYNDNLFLFSKPFKKKSFTKH